MKVPYLDTTHGLLGLHHPDVFGGVALGQQLGGAQVIGGKDDSINEVLGLTRSWNWQEAVSYCLSEEWGGEKLNKGYWGLNNLSSTGTMLTILFSQLLSFTSNSIRLTVKNSHSRAWLKSLDSEHFFIPQQFYKTNVLWARSTWWPSNPFFFCIKILCEEKNDTEGEC